MTFVDCSPGLHKNVTLQSNEMHPTRAIKKRKTPEYLQNATAQSGSVEYSPTLLYLNALEYSLTLRYLNALEYSHTLRYIYALEYSPM